MTLFIATTVILRIFSNWSKRVPGPARPKSARLSADGWVKSYLGNAHPNAEYMNEYGSSLKWDIVDNHDDDHDFAVDYKDDINLCKWWMIMKIRPSGLLGLGRPVPSHAACLAEKVHFILFLLYPLCSSSSSSSTTILTSGVRSRSLACSRGSQHSLPLADCLGSPVPDQSEACHVDCSQPSCVLSSWSSWSEV